ncbi:MAG: hypothetical protein HY718_05300 [Planctomycetes bacterium]|nr:hypothetical protein [Planctomycetota bacterium]
MAAESLERLLLRDSLPPFRVVLESGGYDNVMKPGSAVVLVSEAVATFPGVERRACLPPFRVPGLDDLS